MAFVPIIMAVVSAVGALAQAKSQKDAADYNESVANRNAGIALQQASVDEARQRRETMQKMGAIRAGYGASGVTVEGSPLEILEMSATNGELDAQNIRYKGQLRALGFQDTAGLEQMRGDNAMKSGYIKAGTSLLSAAGSFSGGSSGSIGGMSSTPYSQSGYADF